MARIRIEDLPPVENLTQEELEEIFGAGRFSFKPRIEALETRDMMDAGLGQSLLPSLHAAQREVIPDAGHFRLLNADAFTPAQNADMNRMYAALAKGALPQGAMPQAQAPSDVNFPAHLKQDAETIRAQAESLLANRLKDAGLHGQGYVGITKSWVLSVSDKNIAIRFELTYQEVNRGGMWGAKNTTGTVTLNFYQVIKGGQLVYVAHLPSHNALDKGYLDISRIERATHEFCAQQRIQGSKVYDEKIVAQGLTQRAGDLHKNWTGLKFSYDGHEARDGGLRVWIKLSDGSRMDLDFDYKGMQGQRQIFQLRDVSSWQWQANVRSWVMLGMDDGVKQSLKSVNYTVDGVDRSRELADGQKFADQALKNLIDQANAHGGQPTQGFRISDVKGNVERVELTDDGIKVTFKFHTKMQYRWGNDIQPDIYGYVSVILKQTGEANGQRTYTCVGTEHSIQGDWHGHNRDNDFHTYNVFGLSDAGLKQQYQKVSVQG